jgi:hypothetical protein
MNKSYAKTNSLISELWSALDIMVGLIVTCLPSLRPYLRRDFKASSGSNSLRIRSTTGGTSQNIKVMTSNIPGRWVDHGQFEEIVGNEGEGVGKAGGSHGRIVMIGNDVHVDGGRGDVEKNRSRDSWQDDKRSNNSDIELIQVKA